VVADWGVGITTSSDGIFSTSYTNDGQEVVVASIDDSYDVVAPGTSGSILSYSLSGTPEVLTEVSCDLGFKFTGWTISVDGKDQFYCPLIFTISGNGQTPAVIYGSSFKSSTMLSNAISAAIASNAYSYYAPGTNLANTSLDKPTITWKWEFEGGSSTANEGQTNTKDTQLGNAAASANSDNPKPKISVSGTITAEQVQSSSSTTASGEVTDTSDNSALTN
jgi:hypothetical protein